MRTSALYGAKNFGFFENYDTSARTKERRGCASADIFRTRGEGVNFSRFCADVFNGRPVTLFMHVLTKIVMLNQ